MNEDIDGTELTCQQIIDFMMAYLDGELPVREREIFERHLTICPDCVNYLSSYRTTLKLPQEALSPVLLPEGALPESLVRAILAARTKS